MARPRNDQEGPSAKERMQAAFLEALREKPFPKITVADISGIADVNRNAFYYHFDNIADLAKTTIADSLPLDLFRSLLPHIKENDGPPEWVVLDPANEANFSRLRLLVGPHSSLELRAIVRDAAIQAFLNQFNLQWEDLEPSDLMNITFVLGGMLDLLGSDECLANAEHPLQAIWSVPTIATALGSLPDVFERAAKRAG